MMAGPYHTAQSPEPVPIPRPARHSWAYGSALSVTTSRPSRFKPAHLFTTQRPAVLTRFCPAVIQAPASVYHSVRTIMIYHTPMNALHSGADRHGRRSIPVPAKSNPYLRFRFGTEVAPYRLHSIFPSQAHCIRRPPQTGAARPRVCQEANPPSGSFCSESLLSRLAFGRCNIEFSCRPDSNRYAPVRPAACPLNTLHPGGQLQRFVRKSYSLSLLSGFLEGIFLSAF